MSKERRVYERHDVSTKARIHLDEEIVEGEVKNLSMSGAFVKPARPLDLNAEVELSIDDPLTENLNHLQAKVARVADNGVGLHFKKPLFDLKE
jgi:DNA-directed RNA polymerase subunit E'/Rpb7